MVQLGHDNWERHSQSHWEIADRHDAIPGVVNHPDIVLETMTGERHYYRGGLGSGKFERDWLRVVVGMDNGWVRRVHFARRVSFNNARIVVPAQR